MNVQLLACGIFEPELERVLAKIKDEGLLDCQIIVTYLPAGLHNNLEKLKNAVTAAIDAVVDSKVILLYGSKCHPDFDALLKEYSSLIRFPHDNCIQLISGKSVEEMQSGAKTFYLTPGWLLKWREVFDPGWGVDEVALRQTFGYFDRTLLTDTNVCTFTDEDILDFYEHTEVPIEIENIGLETFRNNILAAIRQAIESK